MATTKLAPLGVRIPEELKEYLKSYAVKNYRSLNAEIVVRLEESKTKELAQIRRKSDGEE